MIEKMGFEKTKIRPHCSYGRSGTIAIDGVRYYCASEAEARWLQTVCPGLRSGDVSALQWQPAGFPLTYKYSNQECREVYRPDAIITWASGEEWVIEIKYGRLEQKAATKLKRACIHYPDRKFVLVWFGRFPTRGPAFRRLQTLQPHLDHIWRMDR
jgi:hypothetical protein